MNAFAADHAAARVRPSPNFSARRGADAPTILILHYTGMESGAAAEDWLCNPASEVSSHYLVHEDGAVVQMVREADRAWHAGRGSWKGIDDINSHSIGIEIVNKGPLGGFPDFPDGQIDAVVRLCLDICGRRGIAPEAVLAHSDVAPGRKCDPGPRFPWDELARRGVGRHVEASKHAGLTPCEVGQSGPHVGALQSMLARYGYAVDASSTFDDRTRIAVEAFQLHFRQRIVDGRADEETLAIIAELLRTSSKVT